MIVVVHWILLVGPIGVFALSLGVGLRAGFDAAPVLLQYIAFVSLITIGITLVAFVLAIVWGRVPIGRFATAFAPVLAIAFSTQSSIASLPAMLEASRTELKIPARITDLVLPLAVAVFRFTSPVANLAVAFFIAHLYGLSPSALQITAAIFVAFAVSVSSVGLPGQVSFFVSMAPICTALGLPLDLLGILLAVEVAPDIFRTIGNVAGDMATTAIVHKHERREPATTPAGA
jgi:Na+/H+-dicarboxylate symporter